MSATRKALSIAAGAVGVAAAGPAGSAGRDAVSPVRQRASSPPRASSTVSA